MKPKFWFHTIWSDAGKKNKNARVFFLLPCHARGVHEVNLHSGYPEKTAVKRLTQMDPANLKAAQLREAIINLFTRLCRFERAG